MMGTFPYLLLALTLACAVPLMQGCSDQRQVTTVERTTTTDPGTEKTPDTVTNPSEQTTTTTTTTKSPDEPPSVLGATASAIGTIILFPFRLVGDALGLIF